MATVLKLTTGVPAVAVLQPIWHPQILSSFQRRLAQNMCKRCLSTTVLSSNLVSKIIQRNIVTSSEKFKWRSISNIPFIENVVSYGEKVAVIDSKGSYTYQSLHRKSLCLSRVLSQYQSKGNRVTFLCDDAPYVVTKWAIWMNRGIAVPLCSVHSSKEWMYFIQDSKSSLIVTTREYEPRLLEVAKATETPLVVINIETITSSVKVNGEDVSTVKYQEAAESPGETNITNVTNGDRTTEMDTPGLIIYTSGTTGQPKGVVLTHRNLLTNVTDMIKEWEWTKEDVILHCLPLHHVHGVVNALITPLYVGATCFMMKFDAKKVLETLIGETLEAQYGIRISIFMAVPTIYAKLIEEIRKQIGSENSVINESYFNDHLKQIRLMVSGSAALPEEILKRWENLTSHRLLERYGMTEIGMALTNSLHGKRVPGAVGNPFTSVKVRIARHNADSECGYDVIAEGDTSKTTQVTGMEDEQGELLVQGKGVFKEYWGKPEATYDTFTEDGWFKTGDVAVYKDGIYKILGRMSVDIIKSGGYKISALYIEQCLLTHPNIIDCAVVGLPDMTWGQKVAAVLVLDNDQPMTTKTLKLWAKDKLASYMIPSVVECLPTMPRNAMGKVNKKDLVKTVFADH